MFYDFSFTIPQNTTGEDPLRQEVNLTYGIIHRVEIGFPKGCAGLAHLTIADGLHQVWPTNSDGSFNTNNYTIAFNESHELLEAPHTLTLIGWNEDDAYQHTIEVRLGILEPWLVQPEKGLANILKKFARRFRL